MNAYCELAKQAVESHFLQGITLKVGKDLPAELLDKRAGVFVTIYHGSDLRGCIGTFMPTKKTLAEEIISNAISASTSDYRFAPITNQELPLLSYEVSVLGEPELIDNLNKLDPKKYGVIVAAGSRRGLLLPDLENVDAVEEQISIAAQKGGIDLDKNEVELYRFTTTKYE